MNLIQKIALYAFIALIACGGNKPTEPENGDNPTDSGLDAHRFDITENQTSDFGMNTPGGRGGQGHSGDKSIGEWTGITECGAICIGLAYCGIRSGRGN